MTKDEDFKLLKIQTCVLKVNIHCYGCKQEVKKILQRIEGVYRVNIDAEQQKVTVSGSVDSATLIKKLVRAGKHSELWSQKTNQNQKPNNNFTKDDKNESQKQGLVKGLEAFKKQQNFPQFCSEEEEDYFDDDDDDDDDEGDDEESEELRFLREKVNQLGILRQQSMDPNSGKKVVGPISAVPKIGGKKGNPIQNMGVKANPAAGIDPRTMAGIDPRTMAGMKLNNTHLGNLGNINLGEGKRGNNDISPMMGLAGFHGNGANNNSSGIGMGGVQIQQPFPSSGLANSHQQYHHHRSPSSIMMNLQSRQQQPQMMYQRSPYIPASTGYYYNNNYNNYSPAVPYSYYTDQPNYSSDHQSGTTHMFSDENTSSCSVM